MWEYQLRSAEQDKVNVYELADEYGGGGHPMQLDLEVRNMCQECDVWIICKVNFVHKQQYKVYNHFENLEKENWIC